MSAEVGQFALILALLLALVQSVLPLWGAHRGDSVLMGVGRQAAMLQAGFVVLAFGCGDDVKRLGVLHRLDRRAAGARHRPQVERLGEVVVSTPGTGGARFSG